MTISVIHLPEEETRSGRVKHSVRVECSCGWATEGNNTFSKGHLIGWADKIAEWHTNRDHKEEN